MISAAFRVISVSVSLSRQCFSPHTLIVTRGRRLWMRPYLASLYKRRLDQGPEPDRPRSVWLNWNYDAEIYSFGKRLGEEFTGTTLKKAFIMRSYIEKELDERLKLGVTDDVAKVDLEDNKQLVTLGEKAAVQYIDSFLKHCYPSLPSEGLSAITNHLLSTDVLVHIASNLGIKDLIRTGEFPVSANSMCTVFKAIIGALHHDQGKARTELFIQDFILTQLMGKDIFEIWTVSNPMGLLVETLHKAGRSDPEPRLLWSTGSETILASYVVGIYVDRQLIGQAPGETVSIAEEMAARDALRRLWHLEQSHNPLPLDRKLQPSSGSSAVNKNTAAKART